MANASSTPTKGSDLGKNSLPKTRPVTVLYSRKSYHSMVVPTVLAIIARRNCAWCSTSGKGPAAMSNVVIMNLLDESLWRPSGGRLLECVSSPSTEVDSGIDVCFLVWLGLRRHCAHHAHAEESLSSMASGANRSPSRERTSLMTRSCKLKI